MAAYTTFAAALQASHAVAGCGKHLPLDSIAMLRRCYLGANSEASMAVAMVFTVTIILVGLAQVIFVLWKPDRSLVDATTEDG
jgi:hypothetical protein